MGLKRKASFSLSHSSAVSILSPDRDQSPHSQPHRQAEHHPCSGMSGWPCNEPYSSPATAFSDGIPNYFNSRTRKRFRDSRPDEETIHQNTLSKLFSAQRQHQTTLEAGPATHGYGRDASVSPTPAALLRPGTCTGSMMGSVPLKQQERSKTQRSLGGFFAPNGIRTTSHSSATQSSATCSGPPPDHTVSTPAKGGLEAPSILTCQDCYAPLLTATSRNAVDVDMMDVEGPVIECEIDDGWECERCRKRICDTCAVRRESRVCLECANPGHGHYDAVEIGEKRWVGGIGWM